MASIGGIIKKIASGAKSGAGAVARAVDRELQPEAPAPMETAVPEFQMPEYQAMELPEIAEDDPDRDHKLAVHEYIRELEKGHGDFAKAQGKQYHDQMEQLGQYVASQPQERKFDPFSAFAITLGSEKGGEAVREHNLGVDKQKREREDYILGVREKALANNIQQLMEEGKFQQALKQSAALEALHASKDRIKSEREQQDKMAQLAAQGESRLAVANVRAAAVVAAAQKRIDAMVKGSGLARALVDSLDKQYGAQYRAYVDTHKSATGRFNGDRQVHDFLFDQWHSAVEDAVDLADDGIMNDSAGSKEVASVSKTTVTPVPAPSAAPPAAPAPPAPAASEKIVIERDGQRARISRKFLRPTDKIIQQ